MACLQLLKSSTTSSPLKFGCFCSQVDSRISNRNRFRFRNSGMVLGSRRLRVYCKAEERDKLGNNEEPPESLFMKELRKRGITPTSLLEDKKSSDERGEQVKFREEDGGWSYSRGKGFTTNTEPNLSDQLEMSRALNSEGLEIVFLSVLLILVGIIVLNTLFEAIKQGLIPRAKLLLSLGATFFMGFWPLILVTVASFSAVYLYFGSVFIHDGTDTAVSRPQYVDPYALLDEERIYGNGTTSRLPNLK